jgi:uncharacterized protein (DUF4415 family)
MSKIEEFPFKRARKITPAERRTFREAYENTFGEKMPGRGRPPKGADKYRAVHIRLDPRILTWARAKAKRRGIGYQTLINETLLRHASA